MKQAGGKDLLFEKIADIYEGKMSIWRVHIERTREQDKNAQVMDKQTFDRLKQNIEGDAALESLPFGHVKANEAGNMEFHIISGHHRIRAARSANVTEIVVIASNGELSNDEIKAKQLAHNALSGESDKQLLKEIYESIDDIDSKIASGIRDTDFDAEKYRTVSTDDISIDFDYKMLKVFFLSSQMDKFDEVVENILADDSVVIADLDKFEAMAETIRKVSKHEDIRALPSIFEKMCNIVLEYYGEEEELQDGADNA